MPIDEELDDPNANEDFDDPNERRPMRLLDSRRQADGELSDSDDEGEGGRRNHSLYRDSEDLNGGHKFGLGGGILNSGSMNSHGAGPSGHTTAVRILSSAGGADSTMDVDTPSADSNAGGSGTDAPASNPGTEYAINVETQKTEEAPAPEIPGPEASTMTEDKMDVDHAASTPAP